jgi:glycosyltransferase involved in cell wall biosynthesis
MKIVHLASYRSGGAGIASSRIHDKISNEGYDSRIIFLEDFTIKFSYKSIFNRFIGYIKRKYFNKHTVIKNEYLFINNKELLKSGLNVNIINNINEADIVFVHWISNTLITFDLVYLFNKTNARIIFVMMDMAHITGGCHYSRNCINFKSNCFDCPALNYKQKELAYKQQLTKSLNISKFKGELIAFSDIDLNFARESSIPFYKYWRLDIPFEKPNSNIFENYKFIILPSAYSFSNDRKGINYFKQILYILENKISNNDEIFIYNTDYPESFIGEFKKIKFIKFNFFKDTQKLHELYESSSLLCFTSISDSAPQMIVESILSNTKVISFDVGYAKEIINSENGYIVEKYNVNLMAELIYDFYKEQILTGFKKNKNIFKSVEKYYQNEHFQSQLNKILNG